MIPVYQRTKTDCYRCCVASVLELPYEDVPDLATTHERSWLEATIEFARSIGIRVEWETDPADVPPDSYCVMGAAWNGEDHRSRNGHAVVSRAGKIVHDPMAGASEKYGTPMYWLWFERR